MPMAKKTPNTAARLAVGTAILAIISGCDSRVGRDVSTFTAPVVTPVVDAVNQAPVIVQQTLRPVAPVVQPEYVVPGAPTYSEGSQAANVQTFESIYGPPVTSTPPQGLTGSDTYTIPSYNDGSVIAQPLGAPVTNFTQQVTEAIAPVYDPVPTLGFEPVPTYDDPVAPLGYAVSSEPVIAAPIQSAPTFGTVDDISTFDASVFGDAIAPQPVSTDTYTIDSVPVFTPEAEPAASLSYDDVLPMTDAMAERGGAYTVTAFESAPETMPAMPVMVEPPMIEPMAAPETYGFPPADFAPQGIAPAPAGVQIIGNDEAQSLYGTPPSTNTLGDRSDLSRSRIPTGTLQTLAYAEPVGAFLASAIDTAPLPRPKIVMASDRAAPAVRVADSSWTAPVPRSRPSRAERSYLTMNAPMPQPRPDYDEPVTTGTSVGTYVSIGALPDMQAFEAAQIGVEPEIMTVPDVIAVPEIATVPQSGSVESASIRTSQAKTDHAVPRTEKSELSGTSWRLIEVGDAAVSVNAELHFDGLSGFAGGQGPCNSYGGEFVNTGKGRFTMSNVFSTDTDCPNIEVENKYLNALENAGAYKVAPDFTGLSLLDRNGREIVRFKAF